MIVREALAQGGTDLKFTGIDTPGLDASLLLAFVLKTNRTSLLAAGTETLSVKACKTYCELIERRCNGECVAYIIGKKEFRGLEFEVNPSVLVPRPDTETLVEAVIKIIKNKPQSTGDVQEVIINHGEHGVSRRKCILNKKTPCNSVSSVVKNINLLDLCTGSGAIAISLKSEIPELEIHATDISAEALETAKRNAIRLLPNSKIQFYQGDLYKALPDLKFNLIVSNPPYIPSHEINTLSAEVQNEPRIALDGGGDGLDIIKRIIDGAPGYLQNNGILLMEADPRQMKDISMMLEKRGFKDIQLYKDLADSQRVIGGMYSE